MPTTSTRPLLSELPEFQTLADPVLERMHGKAVAFIQAVRTRDNPYWLTLWGRNGLGNGTGKTFLAKAIKEAVKPSLARFIPSTICTHWPSLCDRMQAKEDTAHSFSFAEDAGLLILDDIGAEHQTAAMISKLVRLMESRLRKWTILTTNLDPNAWRERDARISSRIVRDGNIHIQCETKDYSLRK